MTEFTTKIAHVASRNAALRALLSAGWPWTIYAADYFTIAERKAEELAGAASDLSEELRLAKERIAQLELLLQGDSEQRQIHVPQSAEHFAIIVQPRPEGRQPDYGLLLVHSASSLPIQLPEGFVFSSGSRETNFEKLFDFVVDRCSVDVIGRRSVRSGVIPVGRWLRPTHSDPDTTLGGFLYSVSMMMLQVPVTPDPVKVVIELPLNVYKLRVAPEAQVRSTLTITFTPFVFTS